MITDFSNIDHKPVIRIHCPNKGVTLVSVGIVNGEKRMCAVVKKYLF